MWQCVQRCGVFSKLFCRSSRRASVANPKDTGDLVEYEKEVVHRLGLRCAPFVDQVRYTKYDPDTSWRSVEMLSPSDIDDMTVRRNQSPRRVNRRSVVVEKVTDEEWEELMQVLQPLPVIFLKDGKRRRRSPVRQFVTPRVKKPHSKSSRCPACGNGC